jgi:hypothetical protein
VQRHLASLEAFDAHTRARGLSLAATAAGFALTGADTPADPHALLARACVVGDIAEFHGRVLIVFVVPGSSRPSTSFAEPGVF